MLIPDDLNKICLKDWCTQGQHKFLNIEEGILKGSEQMVNMEILIKFKWESLPFGHFGVTARIVFTSSIFHAAQMSWKNSFIKCS